MDQKASVQTQSNNPNRPPMPAFLFKLTNPLMKLILNSPLHGGISRRLMVLSFTGRKTGKRYSTPVGYVRQGSAIYVFTHSPWRTNFQKPAAVTMRIQGKVVNGTASLVNDPTKVKEVIRALTTANGEEMARRMGFWVENLDKAGSAEVLQATQGTYFIEIQIGDGI